MALICCPNCGNTISDKAISCPHCCIQLDTTLAHECEECGHIYDATAYSCPKCGCPNISFNRKKRKNTGLVFTCIIVVILVSVVIIGSLLCIQGNEITYYKKIESITYSMLDSAAKTETAGNLIVQVWTNSIYQKEDSETDKFTKENGQFLDDFNGALLKLFSDSDFIGRVQEIQDNQDAITALMKGLRNPPRKYEAAYNDLKIYYGYYYKMTNMVINPVGSLQTFSDEFCQVDQNVVDAFDRMKLYLD